MDPTGLGGQIFEGVVSIKTDFENFGGMNVVLVFAVRWIFSNDKRYTV